MYENNVKDIKEAQKGDKEALQRLIENNQGLIWSIVKRFLGRGHEAEDLYQIGCVAFIKAIKRFDVNYEVQVSTYAIPYILGEIKRYIRDDGLIKVSRSLKELSIKIRQFQNEYILKNNEEPTIQEIAEKLKITKEEVAVGLDVIRPIESINQESEDDDRSLIEKISTNTNEENLIVNKMIVKELIENLDKREKQIILLRYYNGKTQSQIGKILGITQVQVSRIEKRILGTMKKKLEVV